MTNGARPHGEIRQSQMLTTYGPGALVDLPNHAVIVGGLETWRGEQKEVEEPRLVARLERILDIRNLKLRTPPADTQDPRSPRTGVTAWIFPQWFLGPYRGEAERGGGRDSRVEPADEEAARTVRRRTVRVRPLVHRENLVDGRYYGPDRKKHAVVPIRFVQGCRRGHVDDIDWRLFIHGPGDPCGRPLWFVEEGTSSDLTAVKVRCDCGKERSLATAEFAGKPKGAGRGWIPLGYCQGARPWLGNYSRETCVNDFGGPEPNRLLNRTATNAYFSQTLSVISIPDRDAEVQVAVVGVFPFIEDCDTREELLKRRQKNQTVRDALGTFSDEAVWAAFQRKKEGLPDIPKSLKQAEMEMLLEARDDLGEDRPEGDFYARRIPVANTGVTAALERVVLVHRLREVMAQVGFTRFEPEMPDVDGELDIQARRAALAREVTWLPAVENRGEGVFLAFRKDLVDAWASPERNPSIKPRWEELRLGFEAWQDKHNAAKAVFPGLPYLFLHSLSHLLLTSIALECGYAASSIRERVYSTPAGFGILLYTGSSDAEGTLGGLVQQGRRIENHLRAALELGRLCSNDPVCAQHRPANPYEERFLHGSACHGCLLIAETCCERRNEYLDRALVVPTVERLGCEFFREGG